MLEELIRDFYVPILWLKKPLVEWGLFFYDGWSLIHFWSGLMLLVILSVLKVRYRWWILLGILLFWEVLEQGLFSNLFTLFPYLREICSGKGLDFLFDYLFPEPPMDTFNDVFVGMSGGLIVYGLFRRQSFRRNIEPFVTIFTVLTVSVVAAAVGQWGWGEVFLCAGAGAVLITLFRGLAAKRTLLEACIVLYAFYLPLWGVGYSLSPRWQTSFFPVVAPLFFIVLHLMLRKLFGCFLLRCAGAAKIV